MKYLSLLICIHLVSILPTTAAESGKHLFILSGQSNMVALDPKVSFTPAIIKEYGSANVIIVKNANSGQSIPSYTFIIMLPSGSNNAVFRPILTSFLYNP